MKKTIISAFDNFSSSGSAFFQSSSSNNASIPTSVVVDDMFYNESTRGKYSIFEIANWFLSKSSMTHKKLQKLCYYAQAWCYALKNFKLADTVFEAWIHGPVSPALYDRFKSFGYDTIKLASSYTPAIMDEDIELLESVWATYGSHTGNALEALVHTELPWQEARQGYNPEEKCSIAISSDTMRTFYKSIYAGGKA